MGYPAMITRRAHYRTPERAPYPAADSPLLPALSVLLLATGQHSPFAQIYIMQARIPSKPPLPKWLKFTRPDASDGSNIGSRDLFSCS